MKYYLITTAMSKAGKHGKLIEAYVKIAKEWKKTFPDIECRVLNSISGLGNELKIMSESDSFEGLRDFQSGSMKVAKDALGDDLASFADMFLEGTAHHQWLAQRG
jgi:hypothetical protein